jgi:ArsR family transcriptional regulator
MSTLQRDTIQLLPTAEDACCAPASTATLPADRAALAARRFKALADTTRLGILATLAANADPVCACDLGDDVALGQPTVAHHLKVLRDAGLVVAERRGKWAHYQLHPDAAEWVCTVLDTLPEAAR